MYVCDFPCGISLADSISNEQTLLDRSNLLNRLDRIEAQLNSPARRQHFENEGNRTPYFVPPTITSNDASNIQDKDRYAGDKGKDPTYLHTYLVYTS